MSFVTVQSICTFSRSYISSSYVQHNYAPAHTRRSGYQPFHGTQTSTTTLPSPTPESTT